MFKEKYTLRFKSNNLNKVKKIIINYDINYLKLYLNTDYYYMDVDIENYNKIRKYDYHNVIEVYSFYTRNKIKSKLKNNIYKILITLICICVLFLSNNFIMKVNIKTNDLEIKNLVKNYLVDRGIDKFKFKKSYNSIEKIKRDIKNKYPDKIDWIEISKNGYTYNVNIIKRVINKEKLENSRCNYVAVKSGTITDIKAKKGVLLVNKNNFVKKGDVLISGDVVYNNELKTSVCASGIISAEVWYKSSVNVPLKKTIKKPKKIGSFNIEIKKGDNYYKIFNDSNNVIKKKIFKIGNSNTSIAIYKNLKYKENEVLLSEEEGLNEALNISKEKILLKLGKKGKIIEQKVLKKYVKNSTMYVEVLVSTNEEIGVIEVY